MNSSWNSTSSSSQSMCSPYRHKEEVIAEIVVRLCLIVLGTTLNVLVCATFWRNPRLVSNSTLLLWNLSAADLVMSLLSIPASLPGSFWHMQLKKNCSGSLQSIENEKFPWSTGLIIGTFTASIITLVVMSMDRCFMIRLPFSYKLFATSKKIKFVINFIWVCALVNFICMTTRAVSQDVVAMTAFAFLTLCYFVMIICYAFVFWGIKKQQQAIASSAIASRQQTTEKELAKTIAIIIAVFSFSWAPLGYTMFRYSNFETSAQSNPEIHWAATVGMTTAVVNPLIYFGRKKEYREAALGILKIRTVQ